MRRVACLLFLSSACSAPFVDVPRYPSDACLARAGRRPVLYYVGGAERRTLEPLLLAEPASRDETLRAEQADRRSDGLAFSGVAGVGSGWALVIAGLASSKPPLAGSGGAAMAVGGVLFGVGVWLHGLANEHRARAAEAYNAEATKSGLCPTVSSALASSLAPR